MLRKVGRLFTIKTRWEAWLVIYAIALGAVERGRLYLETYPGFRAGCSHSACTGVVFMAGGKLLDAVRPAAPAVAAVPMRRRKGAGRLLVVIDPRPGLSSRLQSYGFHVTQIDAGPGYRLSHRRLRGCRTRNPDP